MPKMKALKRFSYPFGRGLAVGETFEASESDARLFEQIGHAERDLGEAAAQPEKAQTYLTRDMAPQTMVAAAERISVPANRRGAKRATQ